MIDKLKASTANNFTFFGIVLLVFNHFLNNPYVGTIGILALAGGLIYSFFVFRCPYCGRRCIGLLKRTLQPYTCKKCKKTVEFGKPE